MDYLWQHPDWPNFQYDSQAVYDLLYRYAIESSQLAETVGRLPDQNKVFHRPRINPVFCK